MKIGSATVMALAWVALASTACDQLSSDKSEPSEQPHSASQPLGSAATPESTSTHAGASADKDKKGGAEAETQPFQGEIKLVFDYPNAGSARTLTYRIKGDHVAYEQEAPVGKGALDTAVYDAKTKMTYALDEGHKRYVEIKASPEVAGTGDASTLTMTDKSSDIMGMPCQLWRIAAKDSGQQAEVWAATNVPYFVLSESAKEATQPWWAVPLSRNRAFPMRIVVRDKAGQEMVRGEAKSVAAKKLDDASFTVPRDFSLVDSPAGLLLPGVN